MSAKSWQIVMDENALIVSKLFIMGILTHVVIQPMWFTSFIVTTVVTSGLSATENMKTEDPARVRVDRCNESALLGEMEHCADQFKGDMMLIDPRNWCNVTHFIREYNYFSACTETKAVHTGCYWPNPQVEGYIIHVHRQFFSNCTAERVVLVDPPDDTLTVLIAVPVLLTLLMITLVVWRSKRSDIMA